MLEELKRLQEELAKNVVLEDRYGIEEIEYVIGVDQAFVKDKVVSAAVKFTFPELEEVESNSSVDEVNFPYIPSFLMFREGDPAVNAVSPLISGRCVIIVDGSGIAHPRRCGLATYVAIKTDTPSVGVTKKKLYGEERGENGLIALKDGDETIGYVLKSCRRCKPIYVSPGNYITPRTALLVVKYCLRGYRLPEPIRAAHRLANEIKASLRG